MKKFQKEIQNNLLINSLRHNKTFSDLLELIVQQNGILAVPHSMALGTMSFTREFIETHILITNENHPNNFVTINGAIGLFIKAKQL
ncbi:ankyrin repeat domain-containing protein [Anaeramoeba ignava]|uniref:Ankyrin repeat domain-containing protein n=1 Tax=Anaeramoeba ignava TaxID=1746090 RepID=A0A9Q0LN99_ANAIG|nr:ankyrin repeat domain-containing protein [Anaeramoeba ignava]